MKKNYKKIIAILLMLILLVGIFSACSKTEEAPEADATSEVTEIEHVTEAPTQPTTEAEETAQATTTTEPNINAVAPTERNKIFKNNASYKNIIDHATHEPANGLHVVSYLVANESLNNYANLDKSHLKQQTDIIVFGIAGFSENGKIWKDKDFARRLNNIKRGIRSTGSKAKIHINLLGPGSQSSSSVWEDQMADQAQRHSKAFASGKLEQNIKDLLQKYDFDGVFFDYEYPLEQQYWNDFDNFLVSLDKKLGNKYIIGAAISPWNTKQTAKGIRVLDRVEVMSYDTWDNDGNHATLSQSKKDILQMLIKGYDISKLDLGIPFYARPTTKEAYWYGYNGDVDRIDENGLCKDKKTGLTFSYNTPSVVYDKTNLAIRRGMSGVMIWHYACDAPASHQKSLFNAVEKAKKGLPLE